MGVIKPTISLTSNSNSATTDAGPLSIALSLSATDSLPIDQVASQIINVSDSDGTLLWDASDYCAAASTGADGGWIYIKNLLAENSPADLLHDIMVGNATGNLAANDEVKRMFTLQPGEFAWFPWDMCTDIYVDAAETNTNALETWLFVRTGTA